MSTEEAFEKILAYLWAMYPSPERDKMIKICQEQLED